MIDAVEHAHRPSSSMSARRRSRPRWTWALTVPSGRRVATPISPRLKSPKYRSVMTSRYGSGNRLTAIRTRSWSCARMTSSLGSESLARDRQDSVVERHRHRLPARPCRGPAPRLTRRDAHQPGRGVSITSKRPERPICEHECLLGGLFRFVDPSQHAVAGPEHASRLPLHEDVERALIARYKGARQRDLIFR